MKNVSYKYDRWVVETQLWTLPAAWYVRLNCLQYCRSPLRVANYNNSMMIPCPLLCNGRELTKLFQVSSMSKFTRIIHASCRVLGTEYVQIVHARTDRTGACMSLFVLILRRMGKNNAQAPTLTRIRYMCFDLTHAPVATAARAAAAGLVSMSTRPDPERSGAVEIATRKSIAFSDAC